MRHTNAFRRVVIGLCLISILGIIDLTLLAKSGAVESLPALLEVGGNLHPVFLHLPIGIFIYLGFAEVWNLTGASILKRAKLRGAFPLLIFGVISSLFAAVAGLLLYMQGEYSGDLVEQHLLWGVGFAISAHIVLIIYLLFEEHSAIYRAVLLVSFVGVTISGHWGGMITHGDPLEPLTREPSQAEAVQPIEEVLLYDVVAKVFESKCYQCHSEGKKQKGGLLMDSYEALLAGGDEGPAVVPGDLEASLVSTYIHLPLGDELHMPPEGKPQLVVEEIELIDAWIASGAPQELRLMEAELPEQLRAWVVADWSAPSDTDAEPQEVEDMEEEKAQPEPMRTAEMIEQIQLVEALAENSIRRLGPDGDLLSFTAVNAREKMDAETVERLLPLMPRIVDLNLSGSNISSEALAQLLADADRLTRLNVSYTDVRVTSWLYAPDVLSNLESLILTGTEMTLADAAAIAKLSHLKRLYLVQAGLSPEIIAMLRELLPDCEIISAGSVGL